MCKPASFVLTKDRVFWSRKTDSHEEIVNEFGLHQDGVRGPNIARVEIVPPDNDMRRPLSEWVFAFDQDIIPEWCDAADCESRSRVALTEWANAKLAINTTVEVCDAEVYAFGSSTVKAYGSSTVKAFDSSTVKAFDSSTVEAYDSSTVEAFGSSTVKAYGSSTVKAFDSSTVMAYGSSTVKAYGSSTVKACEHESTVICFCSQSVRPSSSLAVVIDKTGEKAVCYTLE